MKGSEIVHLACIMDGNRRFARKHQQPTWWGHQQGAQVIELVADFSIEHRIQYLSLYTFSIENFRRDKEEQEYIFSLLVQQAHASIDLLRKKNIRIRFIGDWRLFPSSVVEECRALERMTSLHDTLHLNILFCYGGRQEIVSTVRYICDDIAKGVIRSDEVNEHLFKHYLWTASTPDPDLIIRTGGVKRLSNFLLYQASYSELYFIDVLWPEITYTDLKKAVQFLHESKRNFGV